MQYKHLDDSVVSYIRQPAEEAANRIAQINAEKGRTAQWKREQIKQLVDEAREEVLKRHALAIKSSQDERAKDMKAARERGTVKPEQQLELNTRVMSLLALAPTVSLNRLLADWHEALEGEDRITLAAFREAGEGMVRAKLNLRGNEPTPGDVGALLEQTANLLDPASAVQARERLTKQKAMEVEISIAKNDALGLLNDDRGNAANLNASILRG